MSGVESFNPKLNYEMALVYWEMGKKEKALEHLNKTLLVWENADPDYKPAQTAKDSIPIESTRDLADTMVLLR